MRESRYPNWKFLADTFHCNGWADSGVSDVFALYLQTISPECHSEETHFRSGRGMKGKGRKHQPLTISDSTISYIVRTCSYVVTINLGALENPSRLMQDASD